MRNLVHPVRLFLSAAIVLFAVDAKSAQSEIKVDLRLDASDFVVGERIRGVVDIVNSSPDRIAVGVSRVFAGEGEKRRVKEVVEGRDRLFVEVIRSSDRSSLTRLGSRPFVSSFFIDSSEGQKLETFLGDHYALREPSRYMAKPVLVHDGVRYEGQPRVFDIVEGVKVGGAMQMFANSRGLRREFDIVYWSRGGSEHLFLKAQDAGTSTKTWETRDLGAILRIDKPTVSVLQTGEVVVLHRLNRDQFVRSEFWSLPKALEFRKREAVSDPDTAGTSRVRELYKDGVKPKENPWWKFW